MDKRWFAILVALLVGTLLAILLPGTAHGGMPLWDDGFSDGNTTCWTISQGLAGMVAVDDTAGNIADPALRIWGAGANMIGATARSRAIPADFSRDYTVRFAFRWNSFFWTRLVYFGHIRLLLTAPGNALLYDPIGDGSFSGHEVSLTAFQAYLPAGEWGWITVRCRPGEGAYSVFVNGTHMGTVEYQETVVPVDTLSFQDGSGNGHLLRAWFDDVSVSGMNDPRRVTFARPGLATDPENDCAVWAHPPDVPYHGQYDLPDVRFGLHEPCSPAAPNGRCYVACLAMLFDRHGDALPSPSPNPVNPGAQEEIAAVMNTNDRDSDPDSLWRGSWPSDLRRAAHFSCAASALTAVKWQCPPVPPYAAPGAAGYGWRDLGYSVVDTVWTDLAPEDEDSVAAGRFPYVLEGFLASGYPVIALFDPASGYGDSLADDEYDGEKDTTWLDPPEANPVGHAVVIIGYDNIGHQGFNPKSAPSVLVHDPAGGKYQWISIDEFWNRQWGSKRFLFAAPWETDLLTPPRWKYSCRFDATILATYTGPRPLDGFHPVTNVRGRTNLSWIGLQPGEWLAHTIGGIATTGDFGYSTWKLVGGPRPSGMVVMMGSIRGSAFGRLSPAPASISYGSYADDIGGVRTEGKWMSAQGCYKLVDGGHGGWPYGGRWWGSGRSGSGITWWSAGPSADLFVFVRNYGELPFPDGSVAWLSYGDPTLAGRGAGAIIDAIPLPPLAPGDTVTVGPVPWTPPPENAFGEPRFSVMGRIECPTDSDSSLWPQDDNNYSCLSEYGFAALRGEPESMEFWMENPEPVAMEIVLEVERSDEAEEWDVVLSEPAGVPILLAPFALSPVEASVTVPTSDMDTTGTVHVEASLHIPGGERVRVTGGVTMVLHLPVNTSVVGMSPPPVLVLEPNAPNPFNPVTEIRYELPRDGSVDLAVYDISGRRVRTLVRKGEKSGPHRVFWAGETDSGRPAASGVYFLRLEQAGRTETRKLVLIR